MERYEIIKELGVGNFGVAIACRQPSFLPPSHEGLLKKAIQMRLSPSRMRILSRLPLARSSRMANLQFAFMRSFRRREKSKVSYERRKQLARLRAKAMKG